MEVSALAGYILNAGEKYKAVQGFGLGLVIVLDCVSVKEYS